jgi:hypothetical protein
MFLRRETGLRALIEQHAVVGTMPARPASCTCVCPAGVSRSALGGATCCMR